MPMYDYYCGKCKEHYSDIKLIAERDESKCPKCGKKGTRVPAAPPFHLKGEGWTQKKSHGPKKSLEQNLADDKRPRAKI